MSVRATLARPAWRLPARRPPLRVLLAAATALALLIAGWLWLRESSLVEVRSVEVTGIAGAEGAPVRAALDEAGRSMTTLHVRRDALETAVAPYPLVRRIEVATDFPHALRVRVVTNVAVGVVVLGGRRVPVTSDGTLLRDVAARGSLPTVPLDAPTGSTRLTDREALAAVAALGAAPAELRARVESVTTTDAHGLALRLAHGPLLWLGDGTRLAAKWAAAAAVLADPEAAGASTIDVTAPERPAVGGLSDGAPTTGESDIPTPPVGTDAAAAMGIPDPAATTIPVAPTSP